MALIIFYLVLIATIVPLCESSSGDQNFLRKLEKVRFKEALREARSEGYSIRGFYHTSTWRNYWKDIIDEQLFLLEGSRAAHGDGEYDFVSKPNPKYGPPKWASLLSAVDKLHMVVAGEDERSYKDVFNFLKSRETRLSQTDAYENENTSANTNTKKIKLKLNRMLQSTLKFENNTGRAIAARLRKDKKIELHFAHTLPRRTYEQNKDEIMKKKWDEDPRGLSEGEGATILAAYEHCKAQVNAGKKSYIFYMHNKGGCCSKENSSAQPWSTGQKGQVAVSEWRELLNTWNVEFPSICLRALNSGYSTCGYGLQQSHYSGNYWWANCEHIAALPPPPVFFPWRLEFATLNVSNSKRVSDEFFHTCAFGAHHCKVNHYDSSCPRSSYMTRLQQFLEEHDSKLYNPTVTNSALKDKNGNVMDAFIRKKKQQGNGIDLPYISRFEACRNISNSARKQPYFAYYDSKPSKLVAKRTYFEEMFNL